MSPAVRIGAAAAAAYLAQRHIAGPASTVATRVIAAGLDLYVVIYVSGLPRDAPKITNCRMSVRHRFHPLGAPDSGIETLTSTVLT